MNRMDVMPSIAIFMPETECVKLMISHQCNRRTRIAHGTHEIYRLAHLTASVNVISQENDRSSIAWIAKSSITFFVTKRFKERYEFIAVTMYITDKVNG